MKCRKPYNPESNKANTQDVQDRKRKPIEWPDFKFGPINLWVLPYRKDLHDLIMEKLMSGGIESMFEEELWKPKTSRVDVIGQNGNSGLHYGATQEVKEREHLNKLIDDHWNYIAGILQFTHSDAKEIGFHYRTAFAHGWKHHKEYMQENK